jgi:predicted XRE-type DNA-binding protein
VLGIHQSTVSILRGYKLNKFSVERLLRLIAVLGQDVVIEIRPRAEEKGVGRVRVVGAA